MPPYYRKMAGNVCAYVDAYSSVFSLELKLLDMSASTRRTQVFDLTVFVLMLVKWASLLTLLRFYAWGHFYVLGKPGFKHLTYLDYIYKLFLYHADTDKISSISSTIR